MALVPSLLGGRLGESFRERRQVPLTVAHSRLANTEVPLCVSKAPQPSLDRGMRNRLSPGQPGRRWRFRLARELPMPAEPTSSVNYMTVPYRDKKLNGFGSSPRGRRSNGLAERGQLATFGAGAAWRRGGWQPTQAGSTMRANHLLESGREREPAYRIGVGNAGGSFFRSSRFNSGQSASRRTLGVPSSQAMDCDEE